MRKLLSGMKNKIQKHKEVKRKIKRNKKNKGEGI